MVTWVVLAKGSTLRRWAPVNRKAVWKTPPPVLATKGAAEAATRPKSVGAEPVLMLGGSAGSPSARPDDGAKVRFDLPAAPVNEPTTSALAPRRSEKPTTIW